MRSFFDLLQERQDFLQDQYRHDLRLVEMRRTTVLLLLKTSRRFLGSYFLGNASSMELPWLVEIQEKLRECFADTGNRKAKHLTTPARFDSDILAAEV